MLISVITTLLLKKNVIRTLFKEPTKRNFVLKIQVKVIIILRSLFLKKLLI